MVRLDLEPLEQLQNQKECCEGRELVSSRQRDAEVMALVTRWPQLPPPSGTFVAKD